MSWWVLLALAGGSYLFKAAGLIGSARREPGPRLVRLTTLLPPALLGGLIVVQTLSVGRSLDVMDARVVGVLAGTVAVWRKAPFIVVIVVAAATTAAIRAIS